MPPKSTVSWRSASEEGELLNKILSEGNGRTMTPKQIRSSFPVFQKYPAQRWSQIVRRARDKLGLDHLRGVKDFLSDEAEEYPKPTTPSSETKKNTFEKSVDAKSEEVSKDADGLEIGLEELVISRAGRKPPQEMVLPNIVDRYFDGNRNRFSVQIWLLSGVTLHNLDFQVIGSKGLVKLNIKLTRNMTDAKRAFSGFWKDGRRMYNSSDVKTVARKLSVSKLRQFENDSVIYQQVIEIGQPVEDIFCVDLGRPGCKILRFEENDTYCFLELRGHLEVKPSPSITPNDVGSICDAYCGQSVAQQTLRFDEMSTDSSFMPPEEVSEPGILGYSSRARGARSITGRRSKIARIEPNPIPENYTIYAPSPKPTSLATAIENENKEDMQCDDNISQLFEDE